MLLPGYMPDEKGSVHLSGHHRRHQLLAARVRSGAAAASSSTRAKCARPTTRGSRNSRRAIASPAAPPSAPEAPTTRPYGALRAIDPATGDRKWEFKLPTPATAGLLTTASNLIFSGDNEGNLLALDSRTGKLLWSYQMGANLHGTSPTTYMLDGRQHLLVPAGHDADGVGAARRPPRAADAMIDNRPQARPLGRASSPTLKGSAYNTGV